MGTLRQRIAAAEDALKKAREASEAWSGYLALSSLPDAPDAPLARFRALAKDALAGLRREHGERRRRFDSVPVLQAALRFRDGSIRRVAVSKPTDGIDEPHIGELFHAALVRQGVVASLEAYPVLVADRRGRVVAEIPVAAEAGVMR